MRGDTATRQGFTIVELIVVIVVIAILAAVTMVTYNGIRDQAEQSSVKAAIAQMIRQLGVYNVNNGRYPAALDDFIQDESLIYQYTYESATNSFCVSVSGDRYEFYAQNESAPFQSGVCSGHTSYVGAAEEPELPPQWTMVSAGASHTCGIYNNKAYCWGLNTNGQLGDGTTTQSTTPVAVNDSIMTGPVTSISAGSSHTCAVADNLAYCWGLNTYGRLGNNSTTQSTTPVPVVNTLMNGIVTMVAVGDAFSCAIASGDAYCWGRSTTGQLGTSDASTTYVPAAVATSVMTGTVESIGAGYQHACAISGGNVYCWGGFNTYGLLGNGTTTTSITPVAVTTGTMPAGAATHISTGSQAYHMCAVAAGDAYCWGNNAFSKLGDGTTTTRSTPTAVSTMNMTDDVATISVGGSHTCATTVNGDAYCWGSNTDGRVGNYGSTTVSTPLVVFGGALDSELDYVTAGSTHSCAQSLTGAYCWGANTNGRLGNGSTTQSATPVTVTTPL